MGLPQILLKLYLLIATPILRKTTPIMLEKNKIRHVLAAKKIDLAEDGNGKDGKDGKDDKEKKEGQARRLTPRSRPGDRQPGLVLSVEVVR